MKLLHFLSINSITHMEQNDSQTHQNQAKINQFFKNVEAIDVIFHDIMDRAMIVLGTSKVGKTASCHLLSNSPLKTQQIDEELVYSQYTENFKSAKIGHGFQPQTLIPNLFNAQILEDNLPKNICLLDMPSYSQDLGFYQLIASAYGSYRVMSKTPKLKFLFVVQMWDITHDIHKIILLIRTFYKSFDEKRLTESERQKILKASCLLVTKVEAKTSNKQLVNKISKLRVGLKEMDGSQRQKFQQFIDEILSQQKIFCIPKPSKPGEQINKRLLLQKIYSKTSFWQRKQVQNHQADMWLIDLAPYRQIYMRIYQKPNGKFEQQLVFYSEQMQQKKNTIFMQHKNSLLNIVKQLELEILNSNQETSALESIIQMSQEFFNYASAHDQKRLRIIEQMFKEQQQVAQESPQLNNIHEIQSIRKIILLEYFENQSRQYFKNFNRSEIYWEGYHLNVELMLYDVIAKCLKKLVSLWPKGTQGPIRRYSYLIHRTIQQYQIFFILLLIKGQNLIPQELYGKVEISQTMRRLLQDRVIPRISLLDLTRFL